MIAALYVQKNGVYFDLEGVDPWDQGRDARLYNGPWPVVAHPPCARWGNYWFGSPSGSKRFDLGADNGCFEAAIAAVRTFGGVLEHPANSKAWEWFGINKPPKNGGWVKADQYGGFTCHVEQGHYGHPAKKATWLYVCGIALDVLPTLCWGSADVTNHNPNRRGVVESLSKKQRAATPEKFRDLLIQIAKFAQS